jgi:phosphatidylinositol-3-phosphatase
MKTSLRYFFALLLVSTCSGIVAFAQTLPSPTHIVVLWMENLSYSEIIGSPNAPHINAIANDTAHAAVFTQFFAIEHPSQPNYLDLFSGANQGITDDNLPADDEPSDYPFTTPNLCYELLTAGKTFKTFSEELPSVGYDGATYSGDDYARKHNPCTNWVGTGANEYSDTVNQPLTAMPANYAALPTVSFVVPNETHDMHDYTCAGLPCPESIDTGDNWVYNNMDSLKNWTLANNTLYIIIYDEDDDNHGNNIPVIFYGPMVKGGTYTENVTHYNLLRTIEDIYSLGHAGAAASSAAITDCWKATAAISGVNNVAVNNYSFKVVPNPASDMITFNCNRSLAATATISVSDEMGRSIGNYAISGAQLQVNTSAFASGLYIYKVMDNNNNLLGEGKFVITHN